jgi:CheY-like chemotaxis protein
VQALGQLAGGIAHDFNNILQAVSGAASLIERRPSDHDRTCHFARAIVSAANRGSSITQRLLSFARRGELRAEPLATADLLSNMREVLEHTLGTTITVVAVVSAHIPALIADQAQLETAIINLGTNARDAMPDGGTLTLSAEAEHVGVEDHHPAGLLAGDYVRLSVADTGTGMDAATLSRVSEPFFTTKLIGQGTGLGVAMVKGFAEQSGGALSITSAPATGTKVSVWLRQATGDVQVAPTVEKQVLTAIGVAARILVVDDDDLVREMVAASLEEAGFGTLVASSGLEAIALIEAGETVDAMVSDLSMPGMNGVATIQKVRALRPRLPCFLLTGYVGERAALSADNTFTLVRKPVSGRALVAQIEASLESARQ